MRTNAFIGWVATTALVGGGVLFSGARASAATIISDTYTDTDLTPVTSHTPDVNTPGGAYQNSGAGGIVYQGRLIFGGDPGGAYIALPTGKTTFQVQADLEPGTGGDILGFYPTGFTSSGNPFAGAGANDLSRGLLFDASGGLSMYLGSTQVGSTVAYGGTFPGASAYTTVTYDVNTAAGTISNIAVQGSTANYSSLSGDSGTGAGLVNFSDGNTGYLALPVFGNTYSEGFDNVLVTTSSAVPEPASLATLALSGLLLTVRRRR